MKKKKKETAKKDQVKNIVLDTNTDYTPKQLKHYLNEKFGGKLSGKKFTNADIYQYSKRGYLPPEYGGHNIKSIDNAEIGIKILRLSKKK